MRTAPWMVGTPSCTSGKAKLARSEAITKSQDATIVRPKPMAGPLTAAMIGFQISSPASRDWAEGISQKLWPPPPTAPEGSFRSAPAQKALPAPVTMPTHASSSSRNVRPGRVEVAPQFAVHGVACLGPVVGDGGDVAVAFVADGGSPFVGSGGAGGCCCHRRSLPRRTWPCPGASMRLQR